MKSSKLRDSIVNSGIVIKGGKFILNSNQKSNIYCDFRILMNKPTLLQKIANEIVKLIKYENVQIIGVPMGAIPLATIVSNISGLPMAMLRMESKLHGMRKMIEANCDKDCILLEDVITTGNSILRAAKKIENEGIEVKQIIVIMDREAGGRDMLKSGGYDVSSIFKLSDFCSITNS